PNPRAKQGSITHGYPHRGRTSQSVCSPAEGVRASWSDKLACQLAWRARGKRKGDTQGVARLPPVDTMSSGSPQKYAGGHAAEAGSSSQQSAVPRHIAGAVGTHRSECAGKAPPHLDQGRNGRRRRATDMSQSASARNHSALLSDADRWAPGGT